MDSEFKNTLFGDKNKKIVLGLCLISIFYFISFDILFPINKVILSFFSGDLFDLNNLKYLADNMVYSHAKVMTVGFLLMCFLIFKRTISIIEFTILNAFVFIFDIYEFMDNYLHGFLFSTGIFNSLLRQGATEINPQYTRILLFLVGFIALSIMICFKNKRTIDRAFVFIISASMIITTFVFHLAIPMGLFKLDKQEKIELFVKNIEELPIKYLCKDKSCLVIDKSFKEENIISKAGNVVFSEQENFISSAKEFLSNDKNKNLTYVAISGNFIGTDVILKACRIKEEESVTLCYFDNKSTEKVALMSKLWFAFLTCLAHFIWIYFGLGLLLLHKNRIVSKLVKRV